MVGRGGFEPPTSRLSAACSNQLSYRPIIKNSTQGNAKDEQKMLLMFLLRKEVIQPHLPVRLPCYDFTLLTRRTLDASALAVQPAALGAPDSDGVTGGVYKARERIHRAVLMRDY